MDYLISPLTAERWPTLEDLFGRAGASNGCWCMYWRIGPRYHDRPHADSKRDLRLTSVTSVGSPRPGGRRARWPLTASWPSAGASWPRAPSFGRLGDTGRPPGSTAG